MEGNWLWWVGFNGFLLAMLALDLGVFHRKAHVVSIREALIWTVVWIVIALGFNAGLYYWYGAQPALEFLTGYLVEKSLAVDNIFVILLIFGYFHVPPKFQHKVLFWGILGALAMRAAFIFAGVELLDRFHWMIYVFGGLLIVTGIKMIWAKDKQIEPNKNPIIRLFRRFVPVTDGFHEDRFWVRQSGRWAATPLFVVLMFVEFSDLIFAVDSIPAILAITRDPLIVYTSNALAILGLRSMYFAIGGLLKYFEYLHYGLAGILTFVGLKMVLADVYKVPILASLGVIAAILLTAILASWIKNLWFASSTANRHKPARA